MAGLPATCKNGHVFTTNAIAVRGTTTAHIGTNYVPCPTCGAQATTDRATYDIVENKIVRSRALETISQIRSMPSAERAELANELQRFQEDGTRPTATFTQLLAAPAGVGAATWLSVIVPVLLTILTHLQGKQIDEDRLVDRIVAEITLAQQSDLVKRLPVQVAKPPVDQVDTPPPITRRPLKGHEACWCGSGQIYRKCHRPS